MDSLTTHYVARELDARWRGRRVLAAALVDAPRTVTLHVEGSDPIVFDLAAPEPRVRTGDAPRDVAHLAGWTVTSVEAPLDERTITVSLERTGKFRGSPTRAATLEISLIPSARGASARAVGGNVLASIGSRSRRNATARPELNAVEIERAVHARDVEALLRGRWMSGHLAAWLIAHPARAPDDYRLLAALPPARPSRCGDRVLPLPLCDDPEPVQSMILPREADATAESAREGESSAARALARMRRELEKARDAPRLREAADRLLLLGDVPTPDTVSLGDGSRFSTGAKPNEAALRTAERLHKSARSLERAAERLPARIAALEKTPPAAPPRAADRGARAKRGARQSRALPYRLYRSTGGLEILVGRGATSNDTLTFKVAAPGDVWLHARGASGAHVLLRWTRDEPPPGRDLEEAAMLAAWHSKARGSSVVPVDWTRRKYVRRPRGGAPGLVMVTRSETLMVRPDDEIERSLRARATEPRA